MTRKEHFEVKGQSVLIAGGSKGLGRELAIQLTTQGANVTVLARTPGPLEETHQELVKHIVDPAQTVDSAAIDLTNATEVEEYISALPTAPSMLFCVAGGTVDEIGFFADITARDVEACMARNYFAAAYIARAVLQRWIKEATAPGTATGPLSTERRKRSEPTRHIVFTASTAAFLGLPGYAAYTPSKAATRALADTLRHEVLLYASQVEISIHCSFPGNFYTDAFYAEQARKPALLKEIEGGEDGGSGAKSTGRVVEMILEGLRKGKYFITMDIETALLLNNMRGPSPRDAPLRDWVLGVVGSLVWPVFRVRFDRATLRFGERMLKERRD
ncbi:putative steroid dehydrogenase [Aspergillus pseudodeflectus]|uniref:Steroid dehydrogenase n=1 Tax=Aspergillus pseudodeflectus TaxID=176178 RepID=A0ABR4JU21_9EURO